MQAYKYETIVQDKGVLRIPELASLVNHRIEVFIIDKEVKKEEDSGLRSFDDFKNQWKGFLKGADIQNRKEDRLDFLQEKYK